jgi:transposase
MTWVGLDVHARSTHGAAINSLSGELDRVRFGAGVEPVVEWLAGLPGPVRAVYEAGPTGFGLKRAADAAGVAMQVVAPGKTPRAASDRVKTDRKDAELLARLLLAGQLSAVFVPASRAPARAGPRRRDARAPPDLQAVAGRGPCLWRADDLERPPSAMALAPDVRP